MIQPFTPARRAGLLGMVNPLRVVVFQLYALAVNPFDHHRQVHAVQQRGIVWPVTQA
ncbi:hypothetical protein D3C76_1648420 [compost metagenome]